ncbi:MAG: methyltransferase domain-containing protein [Candidatus Methylumidiphilus sp.]
MIKRFLKRLGRRQAEPAPSADQPIDVRQFMAQHSVEEFNEAAENFFAKNVGNTAYYLKKPLGNAAEASQHLMFFAEMLGGLKPLPGMRLLDFGASTCWTSRYFAEFKLKVIACDVSPTALSIGKQLFSRNPVVDSPFKPEFSVFNGRRLDLPDESVDRIACFDAFHRVANPQEVLREFARVLKPGGIAGFSGPGPKHSQTAQSQLEMKNHGLVQNDTVLEEIWPMAQEAGFTDIQVAVLNTAPFTLGLEEFNTLARKKRSKPLLAYAEQVRRRAADRRLFFLRKGAAAPPDSRDPAGLLCEIGVELSSAQAHTHGWVEGLAVARNSGTARWLSSEALFGAVKLGIHLRTAEGDLLNRDFGRAKLPPGRSVEPGETVEIPFRIMAPAKRGEYLLEFDLVSENVCWFEANGARPFAAALRVE